MTSLDNCSPELLFWHYIEDEPRGIQLKLSDTKVGPYLFFRRSKTAIQARLATLMPHDNIPRVLLHGSPHIDNYTKMTDGFGMIDFDRSYVGPYIWDIVCSLLAINLRNPARHFRPIPKEASQRFYDQYQYHFLHPDQPYLPYAPLELLTVKKWETDTSLYLSGHHKWAKKLHSASVSRTDPIANALLNEYKQHLPHPSTLQNYELTQLARTTGSFGRRRYLYLLENQAKADKPIFLDIKETKNYLQADWPHNQWYETAYHQQGERMIHSAMLYAPDCVRMESYATVNGVQYWGRQVPILNRKPAKLFEKPEQIAFAETAASQLGRGHRLGLHQCEPKTLLNHFTQSFVTLVQLSEKIQSELLAVWDNCIKGK